MKRENYMHLDGVTSSSSASSTTATAELTPIAHLVDLEDLPRYLPGCLNNVVQPGVYLKHRDRFTVVNYMIDMGYALEQVLVYFKKNNPVEIRTLYNAQLVKKRTSPNATLSLNCGGHMSLDPAYGNTTRCPYEARCHGDQRKRRSDYATDEEKWKEQNGFKRECAASFGLMNRPRIRHPVDYVRHKLSLEK